MRKLYSSAAASAVIALCSSFSVAGLAHAQDAEATGGSQIGDIVVTAQRRATSLQDTPIAMSAFAGDTLEERGIDDLSNLQAYVPNLNIGQEQDGFKISLRGIGLQGTSTISDSGVAFYIDGFYIGRPAGGSAVFYDIDRIEVLRGPQGTLYGRNTTGGAINVITRRPDLSGANGYLTAGFGNFNTTEVSGAGEWTLAPDVFGVRAAFAWAEGDGQLENHNPGSPDMRSTDSIAGRLAIRFRPTDSLDFDLRLHASDSAPLADVPVTIGVLPGQAQADGYVRPSNYSIWDTDSSNTGEFTTSGSGAAFHARWTSGDVQIVSLSAYDNGEQALHNDFDGSFLDWGVVDWRAEFEQFNQDIRLLYTGDRFVGTVGVYYGWDENRTHNTYDFFSLLEGIFPGFNPPANPAADLTTGLFPGPVTGFGVDHYFTQTRTSYAAYAEGELSITDALTVILGVRYTHDEIELDNVQSFALDYGHTPQLNLIPPGLYDPTATFGPISQSDNVVTGRLILEYEFNDELSLYGGYSRGYRSGAINGTAYLSPAQLTFVEPESIDAYELGVKSYLFDRALRLNGAVFYYDYSNQQIQEVILVVPFLRNAPQAEAYGLDLDASWRVSDAVTINWGLGLIETEYKELTLSGVDLAGNQFTNAPEMTSNLSVDWRVGEVAGGRINAFANATYVGHTYFSPFNEENNNGNLQQDPYWTLDGRLSWSNGRYEVALWGRNLLEEEYYTYGLNLQNGFGLDYLVAAAPRTYGVQVRANF